MIEDRNKTELTKRVTAAAFRYLDERGAKPLETEVWLGEGWVADIAGVVNPTNTELQALKLIPPKPKRQAGNEQQRQAWHERAQQAKALMTVLVEVKTSRSDLSNDRKWLLTPYTNLAYLAIPADMLLAPGEYPLGWGLLEYSVVADYVRLRVIPEVRAVPLEQQFNTILQVAYRRDNQTRYERVREFRKRQIIQQNEAISRRRVSDALHAMLHIVRAETYFGETVMDILNRYKMGKYYSEEMEDLWGVAKHSLKTSSRTGSGRTSVGTLKEVTR